jgi:multiple sugar transport system ATP-binding protein
MMTTSAGALNILNVCKAYGSKVVLDNLTFEANPGEFVVLVGPSGCGKSTMLRAIAGLETIDDGEIWVGGSNVTGKDPKDRDIAMVFQDYALYPHKNVYENIAFGLRIRRIPEAEITRRVHAAAEKLDLMPLLERRPSQLSGGQRQRVAIGRAIVREPKAFLFDEPLSNLDAKLRGSMRLQIARLHKDLGVTIVYVTHDQVEAMTLADRIVVLNGGHIQQVGTPLDLYYHPSNVFVATFIGSPPMNLIEGRFEGGEFISDGGLRWPLPKLARELGKNSTPSRKVLWGVRPENFVVADGKEPEPAGSNAIFSSRVIVTETLGPVSHVLVEIQGHELQVALSAPARPHPGEILDLRWRSSHLYLFDKESGKALIESYSKEGAWAPMSS